MKKALRTVLFLPFFAGNPYQQSLAEKLNRFGYRVIRGEKIHAYRFLYDVVFHYGANIVHIHWTAPLLLSSSRIRSIAKALLFYAQILLLRVGGKKIVWTVHNLRNHDQRFPDLERFFQRLLGRVCQALIVHSDSLQNRAAHYLGIRRTEKIHVVEHANFVSNYPNNVSREVARKKLSLPRKGFVLLLFGSIRRNKGMLTAIDTFSRHRDLDWQLVVAGRPHDPATAAMIEKRKTKNTYTFLYSIPDNEVQWFFNACDVVVFPYENYFTSGALHLAMSFQKAVIAPCRDYFKDIAGEKHNVLYGTTQIPDLKEAMNIAYSRRESLPAKGLANFQRVRDHTWERMAEHTRRIYKGLGKH